MLNQPNKYERGREPTKTEVTTQDLVTKPSRSSVQAKWSICLND